MRSFSICATVVAMIALIVCATFYVTEQGKVRRAQARAEALAKECDELRAKADTAATRSATDEQRYATMHSALTNALARAAAAESALACAKGPATSMLTGASASVGAMGETATATNAAACDAQARQPAWMRARNEALYSSLITDLGTTKEDANKFQELLEGFVYTAGSTVDSKDMADIQERMKKQVEAVEDQIRELLGSAGYEKYRRYAETLGDRRKLLDFKLKLVGTPDELSKTQEDQLVAALYEVRTAHANASQTDAPQEESLVDKMARSLAGQKALDAQMLERAKTILSPHQADVFNKTQNSRIEINGPEQTIIIK